MIKLSPSVCNITSAVIYVVSQAALSNYQELFNKEVVYFNGEVVKHESTSLSVFLDWYVIYGDVFFMLPPCFAAGA